MDVIAVKLDFSQEINPFLFNRLMNCLEPDKQSRLKRFYRDEDRLRGLLAEILARHIVREKTGLKNENIVFGSNTFGKPFLKGWEDFHFNLSHSGVWVVGVFDSKPVGIDVEQVQPIDLQISANYYSPDEHRDLLGKPDQIDYFFTLWALKESYIKILGKGLSHPLNEFSIQFDPSGEIFLDVERKRIDNIFFRRYFIDEQYKMAVCAKHNEFPPNADVISTDMLIKKFLDL